MPSEVGLNAFSDADLAVLREMIRSEKSTLKNDPYRREPQTPHQAPETYIALPIPCSGIPGLSRRIRTGTGTGSHAPSGTSTSTGSGTTDCPNDQASPGDKPGHALCDIYSVNTSNNTLQKLGTSQTVYNISDKVIPKDWTVVTRDKFGKWFAMVSNSTGGAQIIEFALSAVICASHPLTGTGTGTQGGQTTYAIALGMAIGTICDGVLPLGMLRFYDDECSLLLGNVQLLTGARGKAVLMKYSGNQGCDGNIRPSCYWSIISLNSVGANCV